MSAVTVARGSVTSWSGSIVYWACVSCSRKVAGPEHAPSIETFCNRCNHGVRVVARYQLSVDVADDLQSVWFSIFGDALQPLFDAPADEVIRQVERTPRGKQLLIQAVDSILLGSAVVLEVLPQRGELRPSRGCRVKKISLICSCGDSIMSELLHLSEKAVQANQANIESRGATSSSRCSFLNRKRVFASPDSFCNMSETVVEECLEVNQILKDPAAWGIVFSPEKLPTTIKRKLDFTRSSQDLT
ncbi:hypothetical protein NDN08_002814 [Rhodosorus marinus]|uniref:Replication factor A C-terminal domain-containing protein n=1 Tax=Rhodosorus marinus TaxID=101924 RepID=A0AAV8UUS1_9RHOD|nr:hypothetical protein NDN08_002814 [Rhodosorus marinus]